MRAGASIPASSAPYLSVPPPPLDEPSTRPRASWLRRSLAASSAEGIAAEVVTACAGGAVLTGWALYLGCSALMIGALAAMPFLAQLMQVPASWLTAIFGRRRVAIVAVSASRQALLPMIALPHLPLAPATQQAVLLAVAAVSAVLGVIGNNAWVVWMGDIVPSSIRGRYFGRRTALCTLGGTLASLAAGVAMDHAHHAGVVGPTLSALALVACLAGALTTVLMCQQRDTPPCGEGPPRVELRAVLRPLGDRSVRGLMVYQLTWNAAIGLASTFFAIHQLRNLGMGFVAMALHGAAIAAVRIVVAPVWGRAIDRVGARPVLVACSFGVAFVPLMWLLPTRGHYWHVLAADAVVSGTLWCGHALAVFALPLAVAPRRERPFYLAAFAAAGGLTFAAASFLGGALASALPAEFEVGGLHAFGLHVIFVASALLRLTAARLSLQIHEPNARSVGELGALLLGRVPGLRRWAGARPYLGPGSGA